ncbi:MAG: CRISPR-associated helicase Cas3' [Candidatus Villigracilaceae bacterium]
MALYPYQERVKALLQSGKSVILQAPTGAGKTRAALAPFIEAFFDFEPAAFPKQCLYSVPMRVLANQFVSEYGEYAASFERRYRRSLEVNIQTGEYPDDPELHGDLVFTTIDQTLSNVLCVPYAVGSGRANLNAGAVIGSYLVFDEFHLYPHDGALKTTLQVLKLLKDVTPFVLMTATFSSAMLNDLKCELGAEVVTVSPDELQAIPSQQNKIRRYHVVEHLLTAEAVLQHHQKRSIAICNTVERAQALFEALHKHPDRGKAEIVLLHARFTASDRKKKEEYIRAQFGNDKEKWTAPSLILVATQVIEVGLDITCENLHTEIAPANAIFQRAGRCSRFANEQGNVFIYDVPLTKDDKPNFIPYMGTEAKLCDSAWKAFLERDGETLDFHGEQEVIDEVHTEADRLLLRSMRENEGAIWNLMQRAIVQNDPSMRRALIRDSSDSRTLLVHANPKNMESPFKYRGFSMFIGSLLGKYEELDQWAQDRDIEWLFKYPQEAEGVDEDSRSKPEYIWRGVSGKDDLKYFPLLVVNPALVKYDGELGFRFDPEGDADPGVLNEPVSRPKSKGTFDYPLEDYPTHIRKMIRVFERKWRNRLQYAATRLEQKQGWPRGSIEKSVRLAIALHDVGKMDVRWQEWARKYQEAIGESISDPNMMIAHTHSATDDHRRIAKEIRPQRPRHAGEGTIAVAKLVNKIFDRNPETRKALRKITLSAIARHHNAQTDSFDHDYRLESAAPQSIIEALKNANVDLSLEATGDILLEAPSTSLEKQVLDGSDNDVWWLAYFLVVRILRMCDGESQEEG